MTFPSIINAATTSHTNLGTTHALNLPTGMTDGNLCLIGWSIGTNETPGIPGLSSWYQMYRSTFSDTTPVGCGGVYARVVDSAVWTPPSTVNITTVGNSKATAIAVEVADWYGASGGDPGLVQNINYDYEVLETDSVGNINPPSPNISTFWDPEDNLFIVFGFFEACDTGQFVSQPPDYTLVESVQFSGSTAGSATAVAYRKLRAFTESPDNWTLTNGKESLVVTVAIRPAATPSQQHLSGNLKGGFSSLSNL